MTLAPGAVFLIGFMGAGKTTVGRELARRLGWRFVDLDDRIVADARRSVAEIFAKSGEPEFRRRESLALHELLREINAGVPTVLALGGGAWAQPQNRLRVQEIGGPVIFLDASLETLRARCAAEDKTRPLFADEARFGELYRVRRADYAAAGARIDTEGRQIVEIVDRILDTLQMGSISNTREET